MRKVMMIIVQVLIFVGAYFVMTPDQLVDNTYVFGLIGSYDIIKGNAHWVMLCSALLSALNILIWWPKVKVTNTSNEAESTKSAEAKEIDQDPKTPTLD